LIRLHPLSEDFSQISAYRRLPGDNSIAAALAAAIPSWRSERAATLVIAPTKPDEVDQDLAASIIADHAGDLRARFGVGAGAALFIADRYGEIVFHVAAATTSDLPLDEVLPILELIEMRCSL
jgi:hypothetical protein